MSYDLLVQTALKRKEAFINLSKHLETIKKTVLRLDPKAQTYLFGSTAEKEHNYSSDIDILIITNLPPANIHCELWKAGIKEPFEIHVHSPKEAYFFKSEIQSNPFFGFAHSPTTFANSLYAVLSFCIACF